MTQADKDLLLKDLCSRLPYGVKCENHNHVYGKNIFKVTDIRDNGYICGIINNRNYWAVFDPLELKPYLFPLSSMTEEQYYEMMGCSSDDCLDHMEMLKSLRECTDFTHWPLYEYRVIDWFIKNNFDYRGLIPMGLALDATGLNIY